MAASLSLFKESPFGQIAARPYKAALCRWFHSLDPSLPYGHKITHLQYRGRKFAIEHRRWTDEVILDEIFHEMQYDLPNAKLGILAESRFREIVASGKIPLIVDCGAHIGVSVLWFAARFPEAHIVAVEPAPDNFALLTRNCRGLDVDLKNAGIGAADGMAHLDMEGRASYGYETNLKGDGHPIEAVTLKTVLASKPASRYTPFLLKVDIEGAEKWLFSVDHALLNEFPVILMELHDCFLPGQGTSFEFFRFHANNRREFAMNRTTVASVRL